MSVVFAVCTIDVWFCWCLFVWARVEVVRSLGVGQCQSTSADEDVIVQNDDEVCCKLDEVLQVESGILWV